MQRNLVRSVRAHWRDTRVLLRESRVALLNFALMVLGGGLLFYAFYSDPASGERLTLSEALFGAFALVFLQTPLSVPHQWYLQILFFLIPIVGITAVANGVLSFGINLMDKAARGQKWQVAMASTYSGHVIVCGIERVGYRIILELAKLGREMVAIDASPEARFLEPVQALGIPVLVADARRPEVLQQAGVLRADVIIPCTEDELANLDIALDAREQNPGIKVVLRMFDPDLARRVEKGFGIHTAYSTSALAAPVFAAAAMRAKVKHAFYVGDMLLNLSEVVVQTGSRLIGRSIGQIEQELNVSVVAHQRGQATDLRPPEALLLAQGDALTVIAQMETLQRLNDMNHA